MMLLLCAERVPKRSKRFILKLADHISDTVHCRGSYVVVGAGAFDAGDKADVAFIIAGGGVKKAASSLAFIRVSRASSPCPDRNCDPARAARKTALTLSK
jgi:hypothetical protein